MNNETDMFALKNQLLFRTQETLKRASKTLNELLFRYNSTQVQWTALHFLANNPGINQSALSQMMNIQSSTAVRLIDRMIRDKLIAKQPLSTDRRNSMLYCTEKGIELYRIIEPIAEKFHTGALQGTTKQELETFFTVLGKIDTNTQNIL
ncbi:MAG: MarR family transcriptional regulator [Spirochaetales bacterium]|jgi:DNA-binding MarR family transcriptional regulator|nr:MarR family transcriptional regulator [Spirochaetales bacterium]